MLIITTYLINGHLFIKFESHIILVALKNSPFKNTAFQNKDQFSYRQEPAIFHKDLHKIANNCSLTYVFCIAITHFFTATGNVENG